ncbi:MAG: hypothetical protein HY331_16640 [Chloroflexi bacterium]|nr:hypothetical protein [Chloroflexota bacterium]
MVPNLIVMLTYNDQTVPDAREVFEKAQGARAQHWGFKDVGLPVEQMRRLVDRIKAADKTTYLEVVRYSEEECLESADIALRCGFDYLMGTVYHDSVRRLLAGQRIKYLPFCGKVSGSPSILEGSVDEIVADGRRIALERVDGFDLLAYRHRTDPEGLARRFVREVDRPVVIAGSIGSFERLDRVKEIGPWGFTIGSAFFDRKFGKELSFAAQIDRVIAHMEGDASLSASTGAPGGTGLFVERG